MNTDGHWRSGSVDCRMTEWMSHEWNGMEWSPLALHLHMTSCRRVGYGIDPLHKCGQEVRDWPIGGRHVAGNQGT
jgi:hypothetical protein